MLSVGLRPTFAVVPVRSLSDGKRRLGAAVDAEEREALVVGLLRATVETLSFALGLANIGIVSSDRTVLAAAGHLGAHAIPESVAGDLNASLRLGRDWASEAGAAALLYLPADLPLLTAAAVERLLDAADAALAATGDGPIAVIAPSDARVGTNALLLAPPALIEPRFGPDSLTAHLLAAERTGAAVQLVADPELGFDLDTPDDLDRLGSQRLVELLELGARTLDEVSQGASPAA